MFCSLGASLAGCASQSGLVAEPLSGEASAGYVLSDKEMSLNCKELMGRMQLRILQIRDYDAVNNASIGSRAIQSGFTTVAGGAKYGADPNGTYARDRAQLAAFNQRLAALNCKTYNLDDELRPKDVKATPAPVHAPPTPNAAKP
ncbi:MAG: hypothetical protein ACKVP4_13015 [Hyphomicrobium sp.]